MSLLFYKALATALTPIAHLYESITAPLTPEERSARLGLFPHHPPNTAVLWFHAFSLGEITAAYNILRLLTNHPHLLSRTTTILFTSSTPHAARVTAARLARHLAPLLPHHVLLSSLLPLDSPSRVDAFLSAIPVAAAVLIESAAHPCLLTSAAQRGLPLVLLDARLSPLSARLAGLFAPRLASAMFGSYVRIVAQTDADARRIAPFYAGSLVPTGTSLKFLNPSVASAPHPDTDSFLAVLDGRPVWVAASTHSADEPLVLEAHRRLRQSPALKETVLVIAPREPHRGQAIANAAIAAGFDRRAVARRAAGAGVTAGQTAVYVADTLGELPLFYGAAPVAFIGNSFGRDGEGHNFAEAAHFQTCVVHGPKFSAFKPLVEEVRSVMRKEPGPARSRLKAGNASTFAWAEPCVEAAGVDDIERLVSMALLSPGRLRDLGRDFQNVVRKLSASAECEVLGLMRDLLTGMSLVPSDEELRYRSSNNTGFKR